jgi:hypothetical protein
MELADNEFVCDVTLLLSHDDVPGARRVLASIAEEVRGAAMSPVRARVVCRVRPDGVVEGVRFVEP